MKAVNGKILLVHAFPLLALSRSELSQTQAARSGGLSLCQPVRGRYVVTLVVDQVMLRQANHVDELVTFLASVNYTGTSSMEIGIKVIAEEIRTRNGRHVNSCFFTMVAVDENRKPVAVKP